MSRTVNLSARAKANDFLMWNMNSRRHLRLKLTKTLNNSPAPSHRSIKKNNRTFISKPKWSCKWNERTQNRLFNSLKNHLKLLDLALTSFQTLGMPQIRELLSSIEWGFRSESRVAKKLTLFLILAKMSKRRSAWPILLISILVVRSEKHKVYHPFIWAVKSHSIQGRQFSLAFRNKE